MLTFSILKTSNYQMLLYQTDGYSRWVRANIDSQIAERALKSRREQFKSYNFSADKTQIKKISVGYY